MYVVHTYLHLCMDFKLWMLCVLHFGLIINVHRKQQAIRLAAIQSSFQLYMRLSVHVCATFGRLKCIMRSISQTMCSLFANWKTSILFDAEQFTGLALREKQKFSSF